jgi:dTDP-4-dehydrorhamnose 3,5-epimerase
MEFKELTLQGLILVVPQVFEDERGVFFERFRVDEFKKNKIDVDFVQDNISHSKKDVLRGLHFQLSEAAQDKLVWVGHGEVFDVAVDLRKDSETFGKWEGVMLTEKNNNAFFIPKGFAHGFLALTDEVHVSYKVSHTYSSEHDTGIRWNDPDVGIDWPVKNPLISEKDKELPLLKDAKELF